MKRPNYLLACSAFCVFTLLAPGFAGGYPYEVYSPELPAPPFFGPGPKYFYNFAGGPSFSWIELPSPGLVVITPRGPVRIDSLPHGTPPTGGITGIRPGGSTGPRVVVPSGSDNNIRVMREFFAMSTDPVNGISFEVGIVDDLVTPDLITGDLTFTFDDGFSQTFTFASGTTSFVGFVKTAGPDIQFVTISSSTGLPVIHSFGIGTVPEPAALGTLILVGGALLARRQR